MNVEILEQVEATTKKLEKTALLKQADAELQTFIKLALDQDVTFGITVEEDEVKSSHLRDGIQKDAWWAGLAKILKQLAKRELTGLAAEKTVQVHLRYAPSLLAFKWATRIINRNLRAGFDKRTFEKAFGEGQIQKFEVQLAETYDPEKHSLTGEWDAQPKLDGNRVILIDGKAMSRGGKEYVAARPFVATLERVIPGFFKEWVMDGEMMGNLGFDQSSGALRRLDSKGDEAQFTYWVFDLIDRGEWERRQTRKLSERHGALQLLLESNHLPGIRKVPTLFLQNPTHAQIVKLCKGYVDAGFEGMMLKDASAPYAWKRSDSLLKVKNFFDADLKVVDFYEGRGKHRGRLGGLVVEGTINGLPARSKVGSGFDDALRDEIWQNGPKWMGATVQVQYQDFTKDGSLRFPVFVMRRKDKE
jgi:DNA ligase-1